MALREQDTAAGPDSSRDPVLDRVYAAGGRPQPPAHLDAAILAAARREVRAGPRRRDSLLRRWSGPFALAAVLVLSVTVVLLMREEGADRLAESPSPLEVPAPSTENKGPAGSERVAQPEGPRGPRDASQSRTPQSESDSRLRDAPAPEAAPVEQDRRKEQAAPEPRQEAPRSLEPQRTAPRPFAEPPGTAAEAKRAAPEALPPPTDALAKQTESGAVAGAGAGSHGLERAERERQAATPAPASPPAVASAPDASAGKLASPLPARPAESAPVQPRAAAPKLEDRMRNDSTSGSRPVWQGYEGQPPEKWLERVVELRRAGRDAEAREMLAEFRRRFPQHPVPATLDR